MEEGGAGELAGPSVVAGALADIAIGIGIAWRQTARYALYAALAISLFYAAAGTILVPRLWADPLGPMLKIWPIMVLNVVALAILEDR
jgi:DoxX-like family